MAVPTFRLASAGLAALVLSTLLLAAPASAQVRISQVYGGGGNSGATYKQDFIELFNAGTTPVAINGWSVQYASATGTTWQGTNLPHATLQPGQYFLVQQAAGTGAQPNLPTPDATGTLAMGGSAGKVALVASTTLLSGACPATWVDLVGYGTTASCQAFATNTSNAQSAQRKTAGCTDTDNNNVDFEALTPVPRNTATTTNPCDGGTGPTDPSMTLAASPSTVELGEEVLFTATVVPGTNPDSTNIVVLADLSALGGAADQRLRDEGTFGDAVAGDDIYSYAHIVDGATAGTHAIPVGVADAQDRRDADSVDVTVMTLVAIHDIQGPGHASPLVGNVVVTEGIVTARRSTGFYLQAADEAGDGNAATSEGIFVYTGGVPTSAATIGNEVRVQATVAEFKPATAPHQLTLTELTAPTYSVLSTGNALPTAWGLDGTHLRADTFAFMERLEGMRVQAAHLVVVAPSSGFITESSASSSTNGVFYATLPGVPRPMREEGVSVLDTTPFPGGITPPLFDANPELLRVQSTALSGTGAMALNVGDEVLNLVGVLDYGFGAYTLAPDTVNFPATIETVGAPTAVSDAASDEITIAGFNLLRFYDDVNDPESDTVLTPAAVASRLAKTANAICKYVKTPDILGVVEVENLSVLQDLADTINAGDTQEPGACAHNPQYVAHLVEGNDIGGIDVGFLISTAEVAAGVERVEVLEVTQLNPDEKLHNPDASTTLLNDRPSLLLRARVHQANGASRELTVIANHLRSLSDVNSTEPGSSGWPTAGARVRAKRAAQAESLANVIQARQLADPNELIVLLGDFNAFEFSDGYVDSMGIISGDAADAGTVMNHVASPVTTPLTNLSALMAEEDRYSFSFDGSAQSLDHLLVNQAILDAGFGIRGEHARLNADFGVVNYGDWTLPMRVSDHDPVVLFLRDPAFATADLAVDVVANDTQVQPGQAATFGVGVSNGGPDAATPARVAIRVDSTDTAFSVTAPDGWVCFAPAPDALDGQRIDCATSGLASSGTASFPVSVVAPGPGGRALTVRASVTTEVTDPAVGNNLDEASVAIDSSVDLAVAVTPSAASVPVGGIAAFGIGIGNASTHAADAPTLDLELSVALAGVQVDAAAGWTCDAPVVDASATRVHCAAASLAANSTAAFELHAQATDALGEMHVVLSATVATSTADPEPANNSASAGIDIEAIADLSAKTLAPVVATGSSEPATFKVHVVDLGPNTARGVAVAIKVNAPTSGMLGLSAPGWTCSGVNLPAGYSRWTCLRDSLAMSKWNQPAVIGITLDPRSARLGGRLSVASGVAAVSTDPNSRNDASSVWAITP